MNAANNQQVSLQPNVFYQFQVALGVVHHFLNIFSTTLMVFLRYRFGERYLGSGYFGLAFLLIALGSLVGGSLADRAGFDGETATSSPALLLYGFAFLGVGAYHTISAIRRRRSGERWHSMCPGISHLSRFVSLPLGTIHRFVEPALGVGLGMVLGVAISGPLGAFIIWSAIALFLVETINARQMKNMLLDMIDQRIEADQRSGVLIDDKPLAQAEGFTVFGVEQLSKETREGLVKAAEGLDPQLQAIMGRQPA